MASNALRYLYTSSARFKSAGVLKSLYPSNSNIVFKNPQSSSFHDSTICRKENSISITLKMADGTKHIVKAKEGETILDCVKNNNIEIEGYGQCDGGASCSTCHVIFKPKDFEKLGPADDIEADILDLTHNSSETSRLGCQVILNDQMDDIEILVPSIREDIREPKSDYSSV